MPQQYSTAYTFGFAGAVCFVCSLFVAGAAVSLKERQEFNKVVDRQSKVLAVAGLIRAGEVLSPDEISERFDAHIEPKLIDLASGDPIEGGDAASFDMRRAMKDPELSVSAPPNLAKVRRIPKQALVYLKRRNDGSVDQVILPLEGKGLWSTMYGFIALEPDGQTVTGLVFYEHGETPGLGGEVDNPRWQALWKGRKVFGPDGQPKLEVLKGPAGSPSDDPYHVDGLSGATLTSRGVTHAVHFWLGEHGYRNYLSQFNPALAARRTQAEPATAEEQG